MGNEEDPKVLGPFVTDQKHDREFRQLALEKHPGKSSLSRTFEFLIDFYREHVK